MPATTLLAALTLLKATTEFPLNAEIFPSSLKNHWAVVTCITHMVTACIAAPLRHDQSLEDLCV